MLVLEEARKWRDGNGISHVASWYEDVKDDKARYLELAKEAANSVRHRPTFGSVMSTSPVRICLATTKKPIRISSMGKVWIGCRLIQKTMRVMRAEEGLFFKDLSLHG